VAQDLIKSDAVRSLYVIAATLMLGGLLMLGAEQYAKGRKGRGEAKIEVKDGLVVGAFQALALIPGMSRSGSTISGALFSGLDRNTAARYSFLLSVPSVAAAGLYELYKGKSELLDAGIANVLVATAVSFVVGYASIALLLKFIQKQGIGVFVLYRFVVAGALLLMLQRGLIQ
jgi:undecaprenyl-diphosphatase